MSECRPSEESRPSECSNVIHEKVNVQAEVTVTPDVEMGQIKYYCLEEPKIRKECPRGEKVKGKKILRKKKLVKKTRKEALLASKDHENRGIGCCEENHPKDHCTFIVSQNICVEIPLTFSASAAVVPKGVVCATPAVGPCKKPRRKKYKKQKPSSEKCKKPSVYTTVWKALMDFLRAIWDSEMFRKWLSSFYPIPSYPHSYYPIARTPGTE